MGGHAYRLAQCEGGIVIAKINTAAVQFVRGPRVVFEQAR